MIAISSKDLERWRTEVAQGLDFHDKEFGTYRQRTPGSAPSTTLAGQNLDLFEQGARSDEPIGPLLNLVFPLVKTLVPTKFFQNPRAMAVPDQRGDAVEAEDAFYVAELLNRDVRDVDFRFKTTMQETVFDGDLLGMGVVRLGYATEFGADILPTEKETRHAFRQRVVERTREVVNAVATAVGLLPQKPPATPEPEPVQEDERIHAETPYVVGVDDFDFIIDHHARDLADARWVAQRFRKTVASVKANRDYGPAKKEILGEALEDDSIPASAIEDFQLVTIWEVHYKTPDSPTGIRLLTFADNQAQAKALLHEDNPYDLGGWQFEWLVPNKHKYRLYPISTISVIRPLLFKMNSAFVMLLEQFSKFVVKVVSNERVGVAGQTALESGRVGAHVKVSGTDDVRGAVAVISMTQLNAEAIRFMEYCLDFIILIVGLTRAQLTGLTTAQTATEAQIGQSGQNLRRSDEGDTVAQFSNRVVAKLWRIKAQFQPFQDIDLPREVVANPQSGMATTSWYPKIDAEREARLKRNRFNVHIELGSIQKPNLEIVRAQFEQFARTLLEPVVTQGLALDGKRISAEEVLRQWVQMFVEYGMQRLEKIVVPITDEGLRQSLLNFGQKPEAANGRSLTGAVPTYADQVSAAAGEKGQGYSPV